MNTLREAATNYLDERTGYHDAILEVLYATWHEHKEWRYSDMVHYARLVYGEIAEFAVLMGTFNYQVNNGGFSQYEENGYASDYPRLLKLYEKLLPDTEFHIKTLAFLKSAPEPEYASTHYTDEDYNDEYYQVYDEFDSTYYSIGDELMAKLEMFFTLKV